MLSSRRGVQHEQLLVLGGLVLAALCIWPAHFLFTRVLPSSALQQRKLETIARAPALHQALLHKDSAVAVGNCQISCFKAQDVCFDEGRVVIDDNAANVENWAATIAKPLGSSVYAFPGRRSDYGDSVQHFEVLAQSSSPLDVVGGSEYRRDLTPVVLYFNWWDGYADVMISMAGLSCAAAHKWFDTEQVRFVLDVQGYQMPGYFGVFTEPLSPYPLVELRDFSARGGKDSNRCFAEAAWCGSSSSFGKDVLRLPEMLRTHFKLRGTVQSTAPSMEQSRMRVAIIDRDPEEVSERTSIVAARGFTNLGKLMNSCSAMPVGEGRVAICRIIAFHVSRLVDGWRALAGVDVLIGVHSAVIINGVFLSPSQTLIEVIPPFAPPWGKGFFENILKLTCQHYQVELPQNASRTAAPGFEGSHELQDWRYWDVELPLPLLQATMSRAFSKLNHTVK